MDANECLFQWGTIEFQVGRMKKADLNMLEILERSIFILMLKKASHLEFLKLILILNQKFTELVMQFCFCH